MPNTTDAVLAQPSSRHSRWTARDTGWMLNLFGTAVGAGILYLPINAGAGGIWPLVLLSLLTGPMVWLAHRNLVRFCLSASDPTANITVTVKEHFGERAGHYLTVAYFLSIYPILLLYGVGVTNIVRDYLIHQLHWASVPRFWLSLLLVVSFVSIMHAGEKWLLRAVKATVFPLVIILCGISLYLIPQWNTAAFQQTFSLTGLLATLLLATPLLIFSFNHSPACSAFAQAYRLRIGDSAAAAQKTDRILRCNTLLLLVVIFFFIFSCVLSLTPAELAQAKRDNIPALLLFANNTHNWVFALVTSLITFLAIASSFFGCYLGTLEGFQGLISQYWTRYYPTRPLHVTGLRRLAIGFMVLTCWGVSYANWSVIGIIEVIVVPVLAIILYIMPVYAFYCVDRLRHYRQPLSDAFTVTVGLIAIGGFWIDRLL